jgi:hypothetical protein
MRRWQVLVGFVSFLALPVPTASAVESSRTATAPIIASGVLVDAADRPTPGQVEVLAWPTGRSVAVGETVQLLPVGHVSADRDGRFAISSDVSPELARLAESNGGYLNLELRALAGRSLQETHFSRYLEEAAFSAQDAGHRDKRVEWQAAPGENPEPLRVRLEPTTTAPNAIFPMQGGCEGNMRLVEKNPGQTIIGELRAPPDTQLASFTYGKRADSDIGAVSRAVGGRWGAAGSFHIANAQGTEVTQRANSGEHLLVRSRFMYHRYEYNCSSGRRETVVPRDWFGDVQSQPTAVLGCANAPEARRGHYGASTSFNREREKATRWDGAVDIFGASLTARSGYSNYVKSHWDFGREADHLLCGDNGPPWAAGRIFAGL